MPQQRILLIRAVNVGGATLPMARFRDLLTGLGAAEVRTYIASGNALVSIEGDPDAFDRAVEHALEQRFGYSASASRGIAESLRRRSLPAPSRCSSQATLT